MSTYKTHILVASAKAMRAAPALEAIKPAAPKSVAPKPAAPKPAADPDPTRYGDWQIKGRCIDF